MHRAPLGVQVRLPDLRRPAPSGSASYDEFTDGGKTEIDWVKAFFDSSDLPKLVDWETFDKKGYHIINAPEDYKPTPMMRWFAEGRDCDTPDLMNPKRGTDKAHELGTYSGKIEFASESLKAHFPDDPERPVSPRYIRELGGLPDGALRAVPAAAPLAAPALLVPLPLRQAHRLAGRHPGAPHQEGRVRLVAGAHPSGRRRGAGVQNGDIVRLHNDRASVLCAAVVTERVRPGVIHSYASSAKYDPLIPGRADSIDKGGCVNMLTPSRMLSKHAPGMTPNSCLIELEKWEG